MTSVSDLQDRWDNILVRHGERSNNLHARIAPMREEVQAFEKTPRRRGLRGFLSHAFNTVTKIWPLKYKIYKLEEEKGDLDTLLASSAANVVKNLGMIAMEDVHNGQLRSDYEHLVRTNLQLQNAQSTIANALRVCHQAVQLENMDLRTKDALTSAQSRSKTRSALKAIKTAMESLQDIQGDVNAHKDAISDATISGLQFTNNLGFADEVSEDKSNNSFGDLMNLYNMRDLKASMRKLEEVSDKVSRAENDIQQAQKDLRGSAIGIARQQSEEINVLCKSLGYWLPAEKRSAVEKPKIRGR